MTTVHVPILTGPIIEALIEPVRTASAPAVIVDFTLGGGGHTNALLDELAKLPEGGAGHRVLAFDRDPEALARATTRFAREIAEGRLELKHARMSETGPHLEGRNLLGCLADLGFSSDQMDQGARGFSFQSEGPLDMRMDPTDGVSAADYLRQVTEAELTRVLTEYGEERFAKRIASSLIQLRRQGKLPETTHALSVAVVRALPAGARHGRIHAATRTFQALRIAVNQEFEELDWLLSDGILFLKPGGRAAILSFHSLEDRRVKQAFKDPEGPCRPLSKKPLEPDEGEIQSNPRARSAKLRIAERK